MQTTEHTAKQLQIQALNDAARRAPQDHRLVVTDGVACAAYEIGLAKILGGLSAFNAFDEANDPHNEHDFGVLTVASQKLWWKIDYYNHDLSQGSPDASDPNRTVRIITIMKPEEY